MESSMNGHSPFECRPGHRWFEYLELKRTLISNRRVESVRWVWRVGPSSQSVHCTRQSRDESDKFTDTSFSFWYKQRRTRIQSLKSLVSNLVFFHFINESQWLPACDPKITETTDSVFMFLFFALLW